MRWEVTSPGTSTKSFQTTSIIESMNGLGVPRKHVVQSRRKARAQANVRWEIDQNLSGDTQLIERPSEPDALASAFERLQGLYDIHDHDKVAAFALYHCVQLAKCESGVCMLLAPDCDQLYVSAAYGARRNEWKGRRFSMLEGIVGRVVRGGPVVARRIVDNDLPGTPVTDTLRNLVCVPLVHDDITVGVIQLFNSPHKAGFTSFDAGILSYFAGATAEYLEKALPSRHDEAADADCG